jgi:hypothetical protein
MADGAACVCMCVCVWGGGERGGERVLWSGWPRHVCSSATKTHTRAQGTLHTRRMHMSAAMSTPGSARPATVTGWAVPAPGRAVVCSACAPPPPRSPAPASRRRGAGLGLRRGGACAGEDLFVAACGRTRSWSLFRDALLRLSGRGGVPLRCGAAANRPAAFATAVKLFTHHDLTTSPSHSPPSQPASRPCSAGPATPSGRTLWARCG